MEPLRLAAHETMEVHEILNFKTICLAKSKMMQGIVTDKDLKTLMQKDVEQSMQSIEEILNIYPKHKLMN